MAPSTGDNVNASPLHIVAVKFGMVGLGLMVTLTVNGLPGQFPGAPAVGVTV